MRTTPGRRSSARPGTPSSPARAASTCSRPTPPSTTAPTRRASPPPACRSTGSTAPRSGGAGRRSPPGPPSTGSMALFQADTGIVPAGPGDGNAPTPRVRPRRPAACAPSGAGDPAGAAVRVDVVTDEATERFDAVVLACDAWVNRLLAPLGHDVPLIVLREQVSYFPAADLGPFQPGRFPVWIWMDDPCFYGFPVYGDTTAVKAAEDCGGPEVDPDDAHLRAGPRGRGPRGPVHAAPGRGRARPGRPARRRACTRSPPTGTSCSTASPITRRCSSPSARPTGSSSRRGSAARWRSSSSTAARPTTSRAFSLTRPGLRTPVDRGAWLVCSPLQGR